MSAVIKLCAAVVRQQVGRDDAEAEQAIHNVAALAKRLRRTDPENAEHLLRFCREAGWEDSILRGEP